MRKGLLLHQSEKGLFDMKARCFKEKIIIETAMQNQP